MAKIFFPIMIILLNGGAPYLEACSANLTNLPPHVSGAEATLRQQARSRGLDLAARMVTRLLVACLLATGASGLVAPGRVRPRAAPLASSEWNGDDAEPDDLLAQKATALAIGATSAVTLWSEISVAMTGCGPVMLNDAVERGSYVVVILASGAAVFSRIVLGAPASSVLLGEPAPILRDAERLSLVCVVGAYAALAMQILHGQQITPDSLSGVDELYCAALRR